MRRLAALLVVLLLAPAVVAHHRSVGGDLTFNMPPAAEAFEADNPGRRGYVNTHDPSLSLLTDRIAPDDQWYHWGRAIGFFDVVPIHYAGTFNVGWIDPIDYILDTEPGQHQIRYSVNLYAGLPDIRPVHGWGGTSAYPTFLSFYAYLFGDGSATDADGNWYVAGQGAFEGLMDIEVCSSRTYRCQLMRPADVQGMVHDLDGWQPAVCGWMPRVQPHALAPVTHCRDFDFRFWSDNPFDHDGEGNRQSPTWVIGGLAGWYANIMFSPVPADAVRGRVRGLDAMPVHFTVGAAFDPLVGPPRDPTTGDGPLACVEPGFDVTKLLAHDFDVIEPLWALASDQPAPVRTDARNATREAGVILGSLGFGEAGRVAWAWTEEGEDPLSEPRAARPAYPEDTHGLLSVTSPSTLECRVPPGLTGAGTRDPVRGRVEMVPGPVWNNWLEAWVYQDAGEAVPPIRDATGLVRAEDGEEDPSGGALFYFDSPRDPKRPRPAVGQANTGDASFAMLDGLYDVGPDCTPVEEACLGDAMAAAGYRDPTALVFVLSTRGPVQFIDTRVGFGAWRTYADAATHCAVGASQGVFADDGRLLRAAPLESVLRRVGAHTPLGGLSEAKMAGALRTRLCGPDAQTLDVFPGAALTPHPSGGSVANFFGWRMPPAWGGVGEGTLDVYYVVSVSADGLEGDQLELHTRTLGDPTVVARSWDKVTFVWQHRVAWGAEGPA